MNLHGGWALIKSTWMSWLQYRSFFFLLAFGWMIPPLISLFVWSTAASEKPIQGLTQGEFVAYYLLFILINQLTYSQTNWTVGDSIRNGDMNRALLRPLSPLFSTLSTELAGKVVYMTFVTPVVAALALLFHPILHLTWQHGLAFVPALLLAWLLRFFWGYWLALLAFWATRANALLEIQDALIFLLAGQVAPVALLPGPLQLLAVLFYIVPADGSAWHTVRGTALGVAVVLTVASGVQYFMRAPTLLGGRAVEGGSGAG